MTKWVERHGGIQDVQLATTFVDAQEKIKALKEDGAKKLILILDCAFPYSKTKPKPEYLWEDLLKWIMDEFGLDFLLYFIPFSLNNYTHFLMRHYKHDQVRVLTGEKKKNAKSVIAAIRSIED